MNCLPPRNIAAVLAFATIACSGSAVAMTPFLQSGSNLTLGSTSQTQTIFGSINNPAAAASLQQDGDWAWKFGALNVGMRVEVGPVDDMIDSMDALNDRMDVLDRCLDNISNCPFTSSALTTEIDDVINSGTDILKSSGDKGYADIGFGGHLPMMPMVIAADWTGGAIAFDVNAFVQGKLRVLDAPVVLNPISNEMTTNTALYIKGVSGVELGMGYSKEVWSKGSGSLYAGAKAKLIQMNLTKVLVGFDSADDVEQVFEDTMDDDLEAVSGVGLDAGLLWIEQHYRLGVTANNLLEPEFAYPDISSNCNDPSLSPSQTTTCVTALSHSNRIDTSEVHLMNTQVILEGALYSESRNWVASVSYDANSIFDPVGNEYQYLVASAGYVPDSWWRPGFRVGYRTNQVGTMLSEVTLGLSWLRVNLDLAQSLETITVDGDTAPRTFAANLGIDLSF